jgi:GNAT superfamily N-acetyltransferase
LNVLPLRHFARSPLAWLADSEVISVARHHDYLETEHSLLAEAAGQPIGFILTEPLDDALFIVEVAVHQAWQHQGIGGCCWQVIEGAQHGLPGGNPHHLPRGAVECAVLYPSGIRMLDELTLPDWRQGNRRPGTACRPSRAAPCACRSDGRPAAPRFTMAARRKSHHAMNG